ncbi:MAG: hypothetical protein OZSIB_2522 [Candidatus Ozemobacter sibiricus]|uniref:Uncharacterized protein n=1 Tax=Candidatus Ozemobacter sibiricus TaxID=2268124 RepID=A0A367ZSM0_9BACT|nr:MAG: hypothetical protein OZSIB_2522 [Candidatus Ozemobacter sibiricus]
MRMKTLVVICFILLPLVAARAAEIGFDEAFSLAPDRAVPLRQLIPGTEDYYYYHCLHAQNQGDLDKAQELLNQWVDRSGYTARAQEIQNRQRLLNWEADPAGGRTYLQNKLNLLFNHQKKLLKPINKHPTALSPQLLAWETLKTRAFTEYRDLSGFTAAAWPRLLQENLDPERRRHLLARMTRPEGGTLLAQLVVADLKHPNSGGFGCHPIHANLLLSQLEECRRLMPELLNDATFIEAVVRKLQPSADVDWRHDRAEKEAYLGRLWKFVAELPPAHNSLKAHVLYHWLAHERGLGIYDKARFLSYLRLPRPTAYMNRKYLERRDLRDWPVDLQADYHHLTQLPVIGDDEPLVRDFLREFLAAADDTREFAELLESEWLKDLFAETKIVGGLGNLERWFSLLSPQRVKAIKERIELDFLPTCREVIAGQDPIAFDVAIKNVKQLIVKIYRINTRAWYRDRLQEIGTDLDLDGLVANEEKVYTYDQPEYRRHVERFAFPQLDQPGVYVIELIGNGRSSRALIRKGRLGFMQRLGAAGHVFTVFDENNAQVTDATLWLGGQEYRPDERGEITVPYSTAPGLAKFVLTRGEFASLHQFEHMGEQYDLSAGFFLDRESLVEGAKATVLVRPWLTVNGVPIDLKLLQEPALVISTLDRDGVAAAKEIRDFPLHNDRETPYEFKVPEKLAQITFTLRGKVENLSRGKKEEFSTSRTINLNGIHRTDKIEDLMVRHVDGEYLIELNGKTGEPKADRPITFECKHREFTRTVAFTLQTDATGRVRLGALPGIEWVKMTGPEGTARTWYPVQEACAYPPVIHALAGTPVRVPVFPELVPAGRPLAALFELRNGTYAHSFTEQLKVADGFLVLDDLPPGDFELVLYPGPVVIPIRLTKGTQIGSWLVSRDRFLQTRPGQPLHITGIEKEKGNLRVRVANATAGTRVHVLGTRFFNPPTLWQSLGFCDQPSLALTRLTRPLSRYLSGRAIGDEYRYILERKFARIFPGNMLPRPSLLLNPWSLRKTETGTQEAQSGDTWSRLAEPMPESGLEGEGGGRPPSQVEGENEFSQVDFLPEPSLLLANLRPDADGIVEIPLDQLGARQQVQVVAVDQRGAVFREISLPAVADTYKDLRMARALDPAQHFSEQRSISLVTKGQGFTIEDVSTTRLEVYDSLAAVYRLLTTLNNDPGLVEFGFILNWPKLSPAEKRSLYSKHACHELNFFLYKKDPEFFAGVIKPYLRNKKDKTFLDHWLLEDDLQPFLHPWAYGRLNIVERILLARRLGKAEEAATARHVKELFDLLPPDPERFNRLFDTAVKGSALETDDRLGFTKAQEATKPAPKPSMRPTAPPPPPPPSMAPRGGRLMAPPDLADEGFAAAPPVPQTARAMAGLRKKARKDEVVREEKAKAAVDLEEAFTDDFDGEERAADLARRERARPLFRQLEKTEEWVENNYRNLPIERQTADLVTVNGFWNDFAAAPADRPFLSTRFPEATRTFTEMMFVLAVLDLPFTAADHTTVFEGPRMRLTPSTDVIVFHKEIKPVTDTEKTQTILTGQNFFAFHDRYRFENNERFDKFVTDEFQTHRVYGCQVVLTNPTSTRRKVDVLLQIPDGALPVLDGFFTRSTHVSLEPFSTKTVEYAFYFPQPGTFKHYPVHVAENGKLIAANDPFTFTVVEEPTRFDTTSWEYVSQNGTDEEVLKFLETNNIARLDLDLLAFRLQDKTMFLKVTDLLRARHVYHDTIWSYSVFHGHLPTLREYLPHTAFAMQCGTSLVSPPLVLDPVARHAYQHREYWPLVNARVYQLGQKRKILNEQFAAQYQALLADLRYRKALTDVDRMAVVYYLLLQDRVEEAARFFAEVKDEAVTSTLQYAYCQAYLAFSLEKVEEAVAIAQAHADEPVDRWRNLFREILAQAEEIKGKGPVVTDQESRDQKQNQLAAAEPALEMAVENRQITIRYQNLTACTIRFYQMDLELLFSRNPFVKEVGSQFAIIHPNATLSVPLPAGSSSVVIDLPEGLRDSNMMIEVSAGPLVRSQAYYPHSLAVQTIETYGQVRVTHATTGEPLPKVYVKVYARLKDGQIVFYKDGYTDLRGKFDYASLSTNQLDQTERFALLIMSDKHGSLVREAAPPPR